MNNIQQPHLSFELNATLLILASHVSFILGESACFSDCLLLKIGSRFANLRSPLLEFDDFDNC